MNKNLVLVVCSGKTKSIIGLTLTLSTNHQARDASGSPVPVFELSNLSGSEHGSQTMNAYWLPYFGGCDFSMTLGQYAPFMFTPTMDGCTFVVGGSDLTLPKIAHINKVKLSDTGSLSADTAEIDKTINIIYANNQVHYKMLGSTYMPAAQNPLEGAKQVTTFGVRNTRTGEWEFYYQERFKQGGNTLSKVGLMYKLANVVRIV